MLEHTASPSSTRVPGCSLRDQRASEPPGDWTSHRAFREPVGLGHGVNGASTGHEQATGGRSCDLLGYLCVFEGVRSD